MSAGNPWDAPGYGASGPPPQGQGQGQVYGPGQVQGPGYGQPPAYGQPPVYGQHYATGAGPWGLPARPNDPGKGMRVTALVLFALAAIADALDFFGPNRAWANPIDELVTVIFVAGSLVTVFTLLPPKTRGFGLGLGLGQALVESARYISEVRPSDLHEYTAIQKASFTGSYILTALGGIAILIALLQERRSAERGQRMLISALALGIPGAVLVFLSLVQPDSATAYSGQTQTYYPCCSWSMVDGYEQTSYVLTVVALLALVLFAALTLRVGLAKGLLCGILVFTVAEVAVELLLVFAPTASAFGFGASAGLGTVSAKAKPGLWFGLAATVAFAVAFFVQRSGREAQQGPYDAVGAGAVPTTATMGFPQPLPQQGWPQQAQPLQQQPQMPQQYQQPQYGWPQAQPLPSTQPQSQPSQQPQPLQPPPPVPGWGQQSQAQPQQQPPTPQTPPQSPQPTDPPQ